MKNGNWSWLCEGPYEGEVLVLDKKVYWTREWRLWELKQIKNQMKEIQQENKGNEKEINHIELITLIHILAYNIYMGHVTSSIFVCIKWFLDYLMMTLLWWAKKKHFIKNKIIIKIIEL